MQGSLELVPEALEASPEEAETSDKSLPLVPSQYEVGSSINMKTGMPVPSPPMSYAKQQLKQSYGDRFSDESIISGTKDLKLGFKFGLAQTTDKKREIIKELYGDSAEVKNYTFPDGTSVEIATKDGKTWHETAGLYDYAKDVPEIAASLGIGVATGGSGLGVRLFGPAIGAGLASFASESFLKSTFEESRTSPLTSARNAFFLDLAGGAAGELVLGPLVSRTVGVLGSPGAKSATEAAKRQGLPQLTGGQLTENAITQKQYKQWLNINDKAAANALERYEALRGKLTEMVDTYGLGMFSDSEVRAMADFASYEIADSIKTLSTGASPIGEVLPRLQDALNVFNKSASKTKNDLYRKAFDIAVKDGVEFDIGPVKKAIGEIEKGVPLPGVEGEPVRFLTPNTELSGIINKIKEVADDLTLHSPDGAEIGSLEQLNTIRRTLSDFAWNEKGSNQGRLATQVLDSVDEVFGNPSYVPVIVPGKKPPYMTAWEEAQAANAAWKSVNEIRKISNLNNADLSSYQSYVVNLVKPGNGPLVELMDKMFKGTPNAMEDVRTAYIDHLVNNPTKIVSTLEGLEKNDPRLLQAMIPNKADRTILKDFAEKKAALDASWVSKQAEKKALSEGDRALTLFEGGEATVAKNIDDYLKYGGPNAKEALQTAFLNKIIQESETEVSTLLGKRVVDADAFAKVVDDNESTVDLLFDAKGKERLKDLYNYALKIKETGVRVPARRGQRGGGDTGTSLMTAAAAGTISKLPTTVEKSGPAGAVYKLFEIFGGPRLMAAILNFDGTLPSGISAVGEPTLRSIKIATRVIPHLMAQDEAYQDQEPFVPLGP